MPSTDKLSVGDEKDHPLLLAQAQFKSEELLLKIRNDQHYDEWIKRGIEREREGGIANGERGTD